MEVEEERQHAAKARQASDKCLRKQLVRPEVEAREADGAETLSKLCPPRSGPKKLTKYLKNIFHV